MGGSPPICLALRIIFHSICRLVSEAMNHKLARLTFHLYSTRKLAAMNLYKCNKFHLDIPIFQLGVHKRGRILSSAKGSLASRNKLIYWIHDSCISGRSLGKVLHVVSVGHQDFFCEQSDMVCADSHALHGRKKSFTLLQCG